MSEESSGAIDPRVPLAMERTLLAWIRTGEDLLAQRAPLTPGGARAGAGCGRRGYATRSKTATDSAATGGSPSLKPHRS